MVQIQSLQETEHLPQPPKQHTMVVVKKITEKTARRSTLDKNNIQKNPGQNNLDKNNHKKNPEEDNGNQEEAV